MKLNYDYDACVRASERVAWRIDDVIPEGSRFDFSRKFLPNSLARTDELESLTEPEQLLLNQIMGNAYLNVFAFVEEYIIALTTRLANAELFGDNTVLRALLRFSEEEIKHQQLFQRFRSAFERDFGATKVIENAVEVAGVILNKRPIAAMLTTLHLELGAQDHYVASVRNDESIEPLFASLLEHHWLEEAQHARIDAFELGRMIEAAPPEEIALATEEYLEICDAFRQLLTQQAELDVESLERRLGRELAAQAETVQHLAQAYHDMFVNSGMKHPRFIDIVEKLAPVAAARIREVSSA